MPSLTPWLKAFLQRMPFSVGTIGSRVPYSLRLGYGRTYSRRAAEIIAFDHLSPADQRSFVFDRVKAVAEHAWNRVPFYRKVYEKYGFSPLELRHFEDLNRMPVVTKEILRDCALQDRSSTMRGRYLVNTGGTAGSPLAFYILPSSIGNEWAHMHRIWARLGYRQHHFKLTFSGRNLQGYPVVYDGLRHQFSVNIYRSHEEVTSALLPILRKRKIKFLHGYPSALYDFACYCERSRPELVEVLHKSLRGAFLGSEYPAPLYRKKIEELFGIPSISWYGHTERSVLAWEASQPYRYVPLQTYGFAEAVRDSKTGRSRLVATSYYNMASPFIRYDTGDEIEVLDEEEGMLRAFSIAGGREGEFILDRQGKRISLTGLIFGRHHEVFATAQFVQIAQPAPGRAVLLVTTAERCSAEELLGRGFDTSGVDIEFSCRVLDRPVVGPSGKVPLKIEFSEGEESGTPL